MLCIYPNCDERMRGPRIQQFGFDELPIHVVLAVEFDIREHGCQVSVRFVVILFLTMK
jgi:hypothetical protein